MRSSSRPQYHRLQRILELIREGTRSGSLPNCRQFMRELEVSRRTLMRDLDFLRDDCRAPIAYDESRRGFRLTDATFQLAPVELTQREVFSFSVARKLLEGFEGTPLELDMRSVMGKIAESLQGTVSVELESLTDQFTVLSEDRARVEPEVWQGAARAINQRERLRMRYQRFDGVVRDYLLEPYHLAAYHGNWYLVALNDAAGRVETFALSRCRSLGGTGEHFARPAALMPGLSSRALLVSARRTSPGKCGWSSRGRWPRISASGCGTRASRCASAGTGRWSCAWKPAAARS